MRNSKQLAARPARPSTVRITRLISSVGFVTISLWSQQSQASSLWLWSWLGIAEVQIAQTSSGGGNVGQAQPATKPVSVSPAGVAADPKKNASIINKAQGGDDLRAKGTKERSFKIIIM